MTAKVTAGAEITLSLSAQPERGDEVIVTAPGSHVFLAADAAYYLSDKVLDVRQHSDGVLRFAVDRKAAHSHHR